MLMTLPDRLEKTGHVITKRRIGHGDFALLDQGGMDFFVVVPLLVQGIDRIPAGNEFDAAHVAGDTLFFASHAVISSQWSGPRPYEQLTRDRALKWNFLL